MFSTIFFMIGQLLFIPLFIYTSLECSRQNKTFGKICFLALFSPAAVYFYMSIVFILLSVACDDQPVVYYILEFTDIIVLFVSILFMFLYSRYMTRFGHGKFAHYLFIYATFFLLEMAFSETYATIWASFICNILIPLLVCYFYSKYIFPLLRESIDQTLKQEFHILLWLPLLAESLFALRALILIYLDICQIPFEVYDRPSNLFSTLLTLIVIAFIFLSTYIILKNVQGITIITRQNNEILEKERKNHKLLEETIMALVQTIDAKDQYTNGHSVRVAGYSEQIALRLGKSKEECEKIFYIGLLHDIGKIGIPDDIINKNGPLTKEEYNNVKAHSSIGSDILSKIESMPDLTLGARYHHERYDGKGYPEGLKGEEIPEIAAIISVADAYDAMTTKRSYRNSLPAHIVRKELINGIGSQFSPKYARIMLKIMDEKEASSRMDR